MILTFFIKMNYKTKVLKIVNANENFSENNDVSSAVETKAKDILQFDT